MTTGWHGSLRSAKIVRTEECAAVDSGFQVKSNAAAAQPSPAPEPRNTSRAHAARTSATTPCISPPSLPILASEAPAGGAPPVQGGSSTGVGGYLQQVAALAGTGSEAEVGGDTGGDTRDEAEGRPGDGPPLLEVTVSGVGCASPPNPQAGVPMSPC